MREAVLRFRLHAQHLTAPAASAHDVAGQWGLQDSPPGSALVAVGARVPGVDPDALRRALLDDRSLVEVYNARSATAVVPSADLAVHGAAQLPSDEPGLRAVLGRALPTECSPADAVRRMSEAVLDCLDGRVLSRDELHEQLRRRLPEELLPWCPGCGSHHARRGLLVVACLRGELCLAGSAGRQPAFARPDQWLFEPPSPAEPLASAAELARRYLRAHGPSGPDHFAAWGGFPKPHAARALAALKGELERVEGHGWLLAVDTARLGAAPAHAGVTLLPPGDPLLLSRDRALLVPDGRLRKRLWPALGAPGAVLAGGEVAGTWRARKRGATLEVVVEAEGSVDAEALHDAADALAPLRGAQRTRLLQPKQARVR